MSTPKIGDKYIFIHSGPFAAPSEVYTVNAVKDDWVQFNYGGETSSISCSMPISDLKYYKKLTEKKVVKEEELPEMPSSDGIIHIDENTSMFINAAWGSCVKVDINTGGISSNNLLSLTIYDLKIVDQIITDLLKVRHKISLYKDTGEII